MTSTYKIYCDGGARGNPGPAASAYLVVLSGKIIREDALYLGKATNNTAEYKAVELAFKWLAKNVHKKSTVQFYLDSRLVVNQLNGDFKVKNTELKKAYRAIKQLENDLGTKTTYKYIPREKNDKADHLVNVKLDESI